MTTRRQFLGGAASLFLCTPAIIRPDNAQASTALLRSTDLPTPDFATLRTLPNYPQYDVGIRPHRAGGVRLSLEPYQGGRKYIIHNYGHSGAGITLSWGCASVVVDYLETVMNLRRVSATRTKVAILGSGIIGLTTATELRRKWPLLPITIYAKGTPGAEVPDVTKTTSFLAGGQFEPSIIADEYQASNRALLNSYLRASARRIKEIEASGHAAAFGIARRKNYAFDGEYAGFDEFIPGDVVTGYRRGALPFNKMRDSNGRRLIGHEYNTWLINPRILLPKLAADLAARNVQRRVMTFENQQQIADLSENVVINCTGMGAKALFNDDKMVPKRGLVVRLPNEKQRFNYFFSGGCQNGKISYLFARQTDLLIGGTVETGQDSEVLSDRDREVCNRLIDNIDRVFKGQSNQCVDPRSMLASSGRPRTALRD